MIPQIDAFKKSTATRSVLKARGSNMRPVDEALTYYWKRANGAILSYKVDALQQLIKACATWLKIKQHKSHGGELFMRRKTQISDLGQEALRELATLLAANGGPSGRQRATMQFQHNKIMTLTRSTATRVPVKPIGGSYQPEKSTYLASGKQKAISGSGVHETHRELNDPLSITHSIYPAQQPTAVQQALAKNVNELTDADFTALDAFARQNNLHKDVIYQTKDARLALIALVGPTGLLLDQNNVPITTTPAFNKRKIYTMDQYGSLFCNERDTTGNDIFNHSSFNAGNDVICAGNISVQNGRLMQIDNGSGHYKPTRDNLRHCLLILQQEGVDLSATAVDVTYPNGGNLWLDSYPTAAAFLAGAQPNQTLQIG